MSEQPTPETDAHNNDYRIGGFTLDFCRRLERERDEAREHAELWKAWERETGAKRDSALNLYLETVSERDEARDQRDGLAAAVISVLEEVGNDYLGCKDELREALASLKGGSNE
jgi:hypothetical protein